MLENVWNLIGSDIMSLLTTVFSIIITIIVTKIKKIYKEKFTDETKRSIVRTVVNAIEQIYKDLSGEQKLQKAKENIINILNEKGISISELEMDMMIEEICNSIKKVSVENE